MDIICIRRSNEIENYISRDDPQTAVEFVNELIEVGESLSFEDTVKKGIKAPWAAGDLIREIHHRGYTLVYEIAENDVIIHEVYN